jgi:hypothetical protein
MGLIYVTGQNSKNQALYHPQIFDPADYDEPDQRRVDGAWIGASIFGELIRISEIDSYTRRVRVKNDTGSDWDPGTLLQFGASNLTPRPSEIATNSPTADLDVEITMASTTGFEVGQIVTITSNGYTDYAFVTAVAAGSITVDILKFDQDLPTVTALPAIEAQLASCNGNAIAEWVTKEAIADGDYGFAYGAFLVEGIDTSAFADEALLYLSTNGTFDDAAPTGGNTFTQIVGMVTSVGVSGSAILLPERKRITQFGSSFLPGFPTITGMQSFRQPIINLPMNKLEPQAVGANHLSTSAILATHCF